MAYLPDGRLLVTEKKGHLWLLDASGRVSDWRHTIWANGYTSRPGRSETRKRPSADQSTSPTREE